MRAFLVGGAVRDKLLDLTVSERDWLVLNATAEDLVARGYQPVGKDFRVFLHPRTHEEWALPRGETSSNDEEAVVSDDLRRRDLTINALALSPKGQLIDPLGGKRDLKQRWLRHTPAFTDDPIRILRLARFQARFAPLGFRIATETKELARGQIDAGVLSKATMERIWGEWSKALAEERPWIFIRTLRDLHALAEITPELDHLFGVPQPRRHHPEVDTGLHNLLVLEQACRLSREPRVRFAALLHDLGKGATPPAEWPRHIGHEARGARLVDRLCNRLQSPRKWRQLAHLSARLHGKAHRALELRPRTLLKLLEELDAFRRPDRLREFLQVCEADARGRLGFENAPYPQTNHILAAWEAARKVTLNDIVPRPETGPEIKKAIARARQSTIATLISR